MVKGNLPMGLTSKSIQLTVAAILVAGAAIPVASSVLTIPAEQVTGETEASTGSIPETVTTDKTEQGLVKDSETIVLKDSYDNTNYTLTSSEYNVISYEKGKFNITASNLDGDAGAEVNSTSDTYVVDYKYKPYGYSDGLTGLILSFVVIGMAIPLLLKSFSFLS